MREIRTHRSMWRELETESRTGQRHRQLAKAVGNSYSPGLRITAPVPDPTENQELLLRQESFEGVGQISTDLDYPGFVRTRRDSGDLDPACRQLDHKEDVEGDQTHARPQTSTVKKSAAASTSQCALRNWLHVVSLTPFRSRVDAIPLQDVGNRGPANPMAYILQRALDSCVAPARIVPRHSDRQLRDDLHGPTSSRRSSLVGPLLGNKLSMPTEDRVRCDDRCDLRQCPPSDGLAPHRESTALVVRQPELACYRVVDSEHGSLLGGTRSLRVADGTIQPARAATKIGQG